MLTIFIANHQINLRKGFSYAVIYSKYNVIIGERVSSAFRRLSGSISGLMTRSRNPSSTITAPGEDMYMENDLNINETDYIMTLNTQLSNVEDLSPKDQQPDLESSTNE